MMNFETPFEFDLEKNQAQINVKYLDVMEISQGGPEIGRLEINGETIEGKYGGPVLFFGSYIFLTMFKSKFMCSGFQLVKINTENFELTVLSKIKDLIYLERIDENYIYYYEDIEKTIIKSVKI